MSIIATLCFIVKDKHILLIRKKRGFGAGKINAPGGRVKPGEKIEDAAVREVWEETGLKPRELEYMGVLEFYSASGNPDWIVHVFIARDYEGKVKETGEAKPIWFRLDAVPYNEMWEDDAYWLPYVLSGKKIRARFWFNKDYTRMISYNIELA